MGEIKELCFDSRISIYKQSRAEILAPREISTKTGPGSVPIQAK